MSKKMPTVGDLLNSGFPLDVCEGNEDAAELLKWFVRSGVAGSQGRPVSAPPMHGTPAFREAHQKLKDIGLVKRNPAGGKDYFEFEFRTVIARYSEWLKHQEVQS